MVRLRKSCYFLMKVFVVHAVLKVAKAEYAIRTFRCDKLGFFGGNSTNHLKNDCIDGIILKKSRQSTLNVL